MARLRFSTAREVFEAFPSAAEDVKVEVSDAPAILFLSDQLASRTPENAISFCAYLLPRREAVWWACKVVRSLAMPSSAGRAAVLTSAERWVSDPEDRNRRLALSAGQSGDPNMPETWVALAAGWSGGGLTLAEPTVPCPPALTSKAVRVAVLTALAAVPVRQRADGIRKIIADGLALIEVDLPR